MWNILEIQNDNISLQTSTGILPATEVSDLILSISMVLEGILVLNAVKTFCTKFEQSSLSTQTRSVNASSI